MVDPSRWHWAQGLPAQFCALTTTREGGVSRTPYGTFNLASHVGDVLDDVLANRQLLRAQLALPAEPCWLNQVHGVAVVDADQSYSNPPAADASFSRAGNSVCAVLTADCLPVVFAAANGEMACAHAGWRGLLNGVLLATLTRFSVRASEVSVWLGPAIGPLSFEVGAEVRAQFLQQWSALAPAQIARCFAACDNGKYLGDLYQLARLQLQAAGVVAISGGEADTLQTSERFYSYRAEAQTGRMATLVWRKNTHQ